MKCTSLPLHRREFITLFGGAAAAWPLAARAQQPERVRQIGVLMHATSDEPESQARIVAFAQGLQEAGWSVGRNVRIETRWSTGDVSRLRKDAAELVALDPDVVLAGVGATIPALLEASRNDADSVRPRPRSGWCWLCRELWRGRAAMPPALLSSNTA